MPPALLSNSLATVPSSTATTGVPLGARMSRASCSRLPLRASWNERTSLSGGMPSTGTVRCRLARSLASGALVGITPVRPLVGAGAPTPPPGGPAAPPGWGGRLDHRAGGLVDASGWCVRLDADLHTRRAPTHRPQRCDHERAEHEPE